MRYNKNSKGKYRQTRLRMDGQSKTSGKNKISIIIIIIGIAVIFFYFTGPRGFIKLVKLKMNKSKIEKEICTLDENNVRLQEEIKKLENDSATIEKEAREKLGLVKKGEVVYKFTNYGGDLEKKKNPENILDK